MPIALSGVIIDVSLSPVITFSGGFSNDVASTVSLLNSAPFSVITPEGFTPVFPLPDAWYSAAVLACSASVCRVVGDVSGSDALRGESEAAIARLVAFQTNRVRDQPLPVFNRNSPLRRARRAYWGGNTGGSP
jgi:hypothetical protein